MVSANEIPPGGEGKITVTVKTGSRSGELRQTVRVTTNIPDQEAVILTVTAHVQADLETIPGLFRFDNDQMIAQVSLKNFTDEEVQIKEIKSPNEFIELAVSALTIPAQGQVIITAELLPETPAGIISEWIEIHNSLDALPIVYIRVWGDIR